MTHCICGPTMVGGGHQCMISFFLIAIVTVNSAEVLFLQCRAHHYSSDGHEVGKKTTTSRQRGEPPKTKQTQNTTQNKQHQKLPTKRLPKKARTRVKRCETCGNATLKLSNVLLQEAFSKRWLPPAQDWFHPFDR